MDSTDPRPLARWWARQTGGRLVDEADGWFLEVVPAGDGTGPVLGFQKVDDPTPGKNKIHLDLCAGPGGRGRATGRRRRGPRGRAHHPGYRWSVLTDPRATSSASASRTRRLPSSPERGTVRDDVRPSVRRAIGRRRRALGNGAPGRAPAAGRPGVGKNDIRVQPPSGDDPINRPASPGTPRTCRRARSCAGCL
ncbi:VOC family protein [Oerskovia sp. M15]